MATVASRIAQTKSSADAVQRDHPRALPIAIDTALPAPLVVGPDAASPEAGGGQGLLSSLIKDGGANTPTLAAMSLQGASMIDGVASDRTGVRRNRTAFPLTKWQSDLRTWARLLRLHHWSKNLLLLVPLLLSQQFMIPTKVGLAVMAVLAFGLVVSGTYIVNDIADLAADRAHPIKRTRPLASESVPIGQGALISAALILGGLATSYWISPAFALVAAVYLGLTLAYSLGLKRVALLDTYIVGVLLTLRVVAGMVLLAVPISPWLISFSIALLTSLAMAKRYAELQRIASAHSDRYTGRDYRAGDLPVMLAFGIGSALTALIILLVYISIEATATGLYRIPQWLYFIPGVLMSWIQRVWLLAHRGELDDDPVVFALRDPLSWLHGAGCALFWALAVRYWT